VMVLLAGRWSSYQVH